MQRRAAARSQARVVVWLFSRPCPGPSLPWPGPPHPSHPLSRAPAGNPCVIQRPDYMQELSGYLLRNAQQPRSTSSTPPSNSPRAAANSLVGGLTACLWVLAPPVGGLWVLQPASSLLCVVPVWVLGFAPCPFHLPIASSRLPPVSLAGPCPAGALPGGPARDPIRQHQADPGRCRGGEKVGGGEAPGRAGEGRLARPKVAGCSGGPALLAHLRCPPSQPRPLPAPHIPPPAARASSPPPRRFQQLERSLQANALQVVKLQEESEEHAKYRTNLDVASQQVRKLVSGRGGRRAERW